MRVLAGEWGWRRCRRGDCSRPASAVSGLKSVRAQALVSAATACITFVVCASGLVCSECDLFRGRCRCQKRPFSLCGFAGWKGSGVGVLGSRDGCSGFGLVSGLVLGVLLGGGGSLGGR